VGRATEFRAAVEICESTVDHPPDPRRHLMGGRAGRLIEVDDPEPQE
jgi:hypothetical protein